MTGKEKSSNRTKAHGYGYVGADGRKLPGVTTIAGSHYPGGIGWLGKWANKLGLDGLDYEAVLNEKGNIGTCAHYLNECFIKRETPNLTEFPPDVVEHASNSHRKFVDWHNKQTIGESVGVELEVVDADLGVGGTMDWVVLLNGKMTIIDFKTGASIGVKEYRQMAAYQKMLQRQHGVVAEDVLLLKINYKPTGRANEKFVEDLPLHWADFKSLLDIYNRGRK